MYFKIVELLLKNKADVNRRNILGTALDNASQLPGKESNRRRDARLKIFKLLRKHGGKTGEELEAEGK